MEVELLKVEESHKLALQRGKPELQALLQLSVPGEGWPEFPEAFVPSGAGSAVETKWPACFFVCRSEGALVGNGGYYGPPNEAGEVEIGYEIAPEFRNRGLATAAISALLKFAFSQAEINAVIAHTLAQPNASNAVLKKAGLAWAGELPNPEVGKVWAWRISK